ncbi:MAG: hypothetical protein ACKVHD_05140, partial [Alphaproteobacteria bacterium]
MTVSKNKKTNKDITIDKYELCEDDLFMCKEQLAYFRLKLEKWRSEVMSDAEKTRQNLQKNNTPEA